MQEKKGLLKDNKIKIGLMLLFIIILVALFFLFKNGDSTIWNDCEAILYQTLELQDNANYCTENSDCKISTTIIPCGCYGLVNKNADLTVIIENINLYRNQCKSRLPVCESCFPPPKPEEIICQNNKCIVSSVPAEKSLCEQTGGALNVCNRNGVMNCSVPYEIFTINGKEYFCICPEGTAWDSTNGCVDNTNAEYEEFKTLCESTGGDFINCFKAFNVRCSGVEQKYLCECEQGKIFDSKEGCIQEGKECSSDSDCKNIDCSIYDKPTKNGYKPYCIDNKPHNICRCMCYGCE